MSLEAFQVNSSDCLFQVAFLLGCVSSGLCVSRLCPSTWIIPEESYFIFLILSLITYHFSSCVLCNLWSNLIWCVLYPDLHNKEYKEHVEIRRDDQNVGKQKENLLNYDT